MTKKVKDIFLKLMLNNQKYYMNFISDLPFLPTRKKLKKVKKLVANLHDKNEYVIYIRSLKQALNHGLILKKVNRVIRFNQDEWLKPYIEINTQL